MKSKNLLKLFAVGLGIVALPSISLGQVFTFDIDGLADPDVGDINASGFIDFSNYNTDGSVHVEVTNNGPTASQITGFYMLRPIYAGTEPPEYATSDPLFVADPSTWTLESELDSQLKNFGQWDVNQADYVGTKNVSPVENRLDVPETGSFTFYFSPNDPIDLDAWFSSVTPQVFIRWQAVGGTASGKGTDFVVPEPSHIAAMAMLGLGGLLFVRRRLTKKK